GVNATTGLYEFLTKTGPTSFPTAITDYVLIGNRDKKLFGGLGNSISFKKLHFEIFFEFAKQMGPNYLRFINSGYQPGTFSNQPKSILERWQNPGDQVEIQILDPKANNTAAVNFANSSGAFSDASYIRAKTVSVSYSFSEKSISKFGISSCTIYVNAQNLFTITGYKGNDPETQSFFSVPPLRTIVAGLNLKL